MADANAVVDLDLAAGDGHGQRLVEPYDVTEPYRVPVGQVPCDSL